MKPNKSNFIYHKWTITFTIEHKAKNFVEEKEVEQSSEQLQLV